MKTYRIKPLNWVETWNDQYIKHKARTPFGVFLVWCEKQEGGPTNKWLWMYWFHAGVADDGSCVSVEEGKRVCEKEWKRRIKKVLEEVSHGA